MALLATGMACLLFFPLVSRLGSALPVSYRDPLLNAWILGWTADRLIAGGEGLWHAPIFHPYRNTLAWSEHLLGIGAFTTPIYALTENGILAHNVVVILSFGLAAAGAYLLTFELTGRRDVALVAAMLFAFSPYRVAAQITRVQVLMTGWLPVVLWALHRWGRVQHPALLVVGVAAFVLQVLSNTYMLYVAAVPVLLVVSVSLWRSCGRGIRQLAAAATCAGLLLLPFLLKYYETQQSMGFQRSLEENVSYSAAVESYVSVPPTAHGLPWLRHEQTADQALYPGTVLLVLAMIGVVGALQSTPRSGARFARGSSLSAVSVPGLYLLILAVAFTLSLGPQPRLLGEVSPIAGPYGWLMDLVPGLDALRAPSRFAIVVVLALTVLAAFGTAHLLGRQSRRGRLVVAGGLMTALLLEAGTAAQWPVKTMGPRGRAHDAPLHRWLASRPAGAIVELPMAPHAMHTWDLTLAYQYATLYHGHTLLSGYSGYNSPLADLFQGHASPLTNPPEIPAVVSALRRLGVRFIVVHVNDYRRRSQARGIVTELRAASGIGREHRIGRTVVFELAPTARRGETTVRYREVARRRWKVVASAGAQTLSALTDGRLETCWGTGRAQQGDESLEVTLHRSVDIAGIRLELGQRREEYPRSLRAEAIGSDGVEQVLFDGAVLPQLAVGLVSEPVVAPIDLDLPRARLVRLRLRQKGTSPLRQWSICELRLFERRSTARQLPDTQTEGP